MQVWRLLSNPKSICAKVLKAKYYPSGDLLSDELKKGATHSARDGGSTGLAPDEKWNIFSAVDIFLGEGIPALFKLQNVGYQTEKYPRRLRYGGKSRN